jgi:hypothetical protein
LFVSRYDQILLFTGTAAIPLWKTPVFDGAPGDILITVKGCAILGVEELPH